MLNSASGNVSKLGNWSSFKSMASHAVDMPLTPNSFSFTSLQLYGMSTGPRVEHPLSFTG